MKTRIFIETTIPSFYYTERSDAQSIVRQQWTRQWWTEYAQQVTLTSSVAVIDELRQGKGVLTVQRLALLDSLTFLPITSEIVEIAQIYVEQKVMPYAPKGDALHLAVASFHKVDALLTWNCRHLANANKFNRIRRINFELGLPTPNLATPLNYLGG